jgi:hypothetical protein
LASSSIAFTAFAAEDDEVGTEPPRQISHKYRVAYYHGGDWIDYYRTLVGVTEGLMALGWVEQADIPEQADASTAWLWKWLSGQSRSRHIQFVEDGFFSAGWNSQEREKVKSELMRRLNEGDIDLVIASGTWAGQDLANDLHQTPVVVVSSSDPVRSGIVSSVDDSGYDHVHAHVDPDLHERQVRVFLNLETAAQIGYVPSAGILLASDEIHGKVGGSK